MPPARRNQPLAFSATRWTLLHRVQKGSEAEAALAMEEICWRYWWRVYAFARRAGFPAHNAEDLTQTFFQRLITSEAMPDAREEKGRLRSFMLALLKRIISNHIRHASAEKRGGSPDATLSFDDDSAEARHLAEPADVRDPAALFDRAWAEEVLREAEQMVRAEFARGNNLEDFERLREYLPHGANATPCPELAASMGITESALRLQIHRMRKRYAGFIEDQITQTVSTPDEAKAELEHLMRVIGR